MNTVTRTMSPQEIAALYKRLAPVARKESRPQYTHWQIKTSDTTITAYTSGKVVFQGKDVSWLADDSPAPSKSACAPQSSDAAHTRACTFPMAGSDEVGTGDYFGPVTVAAVIVENQETADRLKALHITDSKAMTDAVIMKVAPEIMKMVPYSIKMLDNLHYNQVWNSETMNLNRIKSLMHNRVYRELASEHELPANRIVDQFCVENSYYRHVAAVRKPEEVVRGLHFETKSESKYIAVAAASVLARYAFLKAMEALDQKWNFHFEKGAGKNVDACGRKFMHDHTLQDLRQVAKLHFANTRKIGVEL